MKNCSILKFCQSYNSVRSDKQKLIKDSIGRQLPYIVNFIESTCQIFDIELERITHAYTFPNGCRLIDVDYFPTIEDQFGIVIGVEDAKKRWGAENFVVALRASRKPPTMRITNAIAIPSRITVVKTLFSNLNMAEGQQIGNLGLHQRLSFWPHIVAIGCNDAKCFITILPNFGGVTTRMSLHPSRSMNDLISGFVENDIFRYSLEDGAFREYPCSGVYVSSLALMPRSRTLMIGLSMGGIIAASLNSSNCLKMLELRHERLIQKIAPLEPEDDPDKFEYFIAAVDRSPRHSIMIQLWRGSFKDDEGVNADPKYDRPNYSVCLEHKIPFGERWIAVNPIVTERGNMELTLIKQNDSPTDSMLNASQSFGSSSNRSSVFMAYERKTIGVGDSINRPYLLEAAVFDIDAWYYNRVPPKVQLDDTSLNQCPFMSCIESDILSKDVGDIGILTLHSTDMYRFSSMNSDADQLFYPSAVSYDRVFVAENTKIRWMRIQNIQETILENCATHLSLIAHSPDAMAADIISAGLLRNNILTGSPNSSVVVEFVDSQPELNAHLKVVLCAMIYYGKVQEFCDLLNLHSMNNKTKLDIAKWAVYQAIDFKKVISDRTASIFEGSAIVLSPLAENTIHQGIKLFRVVYEYVKSCVQNLNDAGYLRGYACSLKCMQNHTELVRRFLIYHIIPVNIPMEYLMRQMHENKKNTAMKNKTALPVQLITRNMHSIAPFAQFWNNLPHDEWYPPNPLDLLESLLNVSISERTKRELVVQFILDWIRAEPSYLNYTDDRLCLDVIKVMSNQMLHVDSEKVNYVLNKENIALMKPETVALDRDKTIKKNIFSLEDERFTYEKILKDDVHSKTIKSNELEIFKQKSRSQEKGEKLQAFDSETEKINQAFLFENQKCRLMQKDFKVQEIERNVKEMFEKYQKKEDIAIPELFASLGNKISDKKDEKVASPPIAKTETDAITDLSVEKNKDRHSSSNLESDALINQMIATPARYYKRPVQPSGMVSPTHSQKHAPVLYQNSILKTAKLVQSPSRGRIRFHSSVQQVQNNTSVLENQSFQSIVSDDIPKHIDFSILEDEQNEQSYCRRSSSWKNLESLKSVENNKKEGEPDTFKEIENEISVKRSMTSDRNMGEIEDNRGLVESFRKCDQNTTMTQFSQKITMKANKDEMENDKQPSEVSEVTNAKEQDCDEHRPTRREVQNDDDCSPLLAVRNEYLNIDTMNKVEMNDDPSQDIPLDCILELQGDEQEPQPLADSYENMKKQRRDPFLLEKDRNKSAEDVETSKTSEFDRPPSANTRSNCRMKTVSRSITPIEEEKSHKTQKLKDPIAHKTAETDEDKEERSLPVIKKIGSLKRSKTSDLTKEEDVKIVKEKTSINPPSIKKAKPVTIQRLNSESGVVETSSASGRVTRSRANTPSREINTELSNVHIGKTSERSSTPTEVTSGRLPDPSGSLLSRRFSNRIKYRPSSVVSDDYTPAASASSNRMTEGHTSAPTTRKRGKMAFERELSVPLIETRRATSTNDTPKGEPANKARGRSKTTPLKAISEYSEDRNLGSSETTVTPKRGRSRKNSTSSTLSTAPTTPKRGRKAVTVLEGVPEENKSEPTTPVRRSARRLPKPNL